MSDEVAKILVVDDKRANLMAMKKLLTKVDAQVITAVSGNEALALTLEHDFALILLDINMPEMDGYEVADCLAGEEKTSRVPIIFVTAAYKDMPHTERAYDSGAVDYIEKPINSAILLAKVRVFLELYRKNQQLKIAKELAEKSTEDKSAFLAQVSHEIRTPMNAIIGFTHLAMQTGLTPKQHGYLSNIQTASDALLGLINDLLDHSKIEAGKLTIESVNFNLDQVIDNVSTLVVTTAQEKGLEIVFSIDDNVPRLLTGDPLRLGQVLTNITNNAIKFTDRGEVIVNVALAPETGSPPFQRVSTGDQVIIEFSVTDSGIGINKAQLKNLFQPYQQANLATTRRYGGTGLGLSISKQLTELMGGNIGVESTPGKGSRFHFTVLCGRKKEQPSPYPEPTRSLEGMRVLVVDDNASSRKALTAILGTFNVNVTQADSGEAALAAIDAAENTQPFQLVLMDWMMPGMDGVEAAWKIKQHPSLPATPIIIMVTAHKHSALRQQAEEAGLDGFLIKPVNHSVMLDTISDVLRQAVTQSPSQMVEIGSEEQILRMLHGAKILLVEDNEFNQMVATEVLETAGVSITVTSNGQEAINALQEASFDAVLMDANMPIMDGYTATRTIRKKEHFRSLPIIAMTANASSKDRERCLESGMNDHVSKPINPKKMFATLATWLSKGSKAPESPPLPSTEPCAEEHLDQLLETALSKQKLPGINVQEGLERFAGDENVYRDIMLAFLNIHGDDAEKIHGLLAVGEHALVLKMLHTLKGSAGNLAANELYTAVCELEECLKTDNREGYIGALLAHLDQCMDTVCQSLQTLETTN